MCQVSEPSGNPLQHFPEVSEGTDCLLIMGKDGAQVLFQEAQQGPDSQRGTN